MRTLSSVEEEPLEGMDKVNIPRAYTVTSDSGPHRYAVRRSRIGWTCNCPGYQFRAQKKMGYCCKHIKLAQAKLNSRLSSLLRLLKEEEHENVQSLTV